jgi:hypothetical protein
MEYLCVVIDNSTNKTLAEYEIEASNEPFACWKADRLFRTNNPNLVVDWTVDSLKLE